MIIVGESYGAKSPEDFPLDLGIAYSMIPCNEGLYPKWPRPVDLRGSAAGPFPKETRVILYGPQGNWRKENCSFKTSIEYKHARPKRNFVI